MPLHPAVAEDDLIMKPDVLELVATPEEISDPEEVYPVVSSPPLGPIWTDIPAAPFVDTPENTRVILRAHDGTVVVRATLEPEEVATEAERGTTLCG
jgi:hypothetical protein